jgi:tetratricopeptide (TPR) repeat protein
MVPSEVPKPQHIVRSTPARHLWLAGVWCGCAIALAGSSWALAQGTNVGQSSVIPAPCLTQYGNSGKIAELVHTLQSHPSAEGYNALGALFARGDDLQCAVPAFEEALLLDPKAWEARYNLADALVSTGHPKEAAQQLRLLLEQRPDSAPAHNALGMILEDQEELEAAATEFKAALTSDPHFGMASYNLAQVLMAQKRYPAAISCLQTALQSGLPPELTSHLQVALGVAYGQSGDTGKAIETLRQVIRRHPRLAEAHFNLAAVYAKQGAALGYQTAVTEYKETLRINPNDDDARYSLAKVLINLGKPQEAISLLTEYVRNRPKDAPGYHLLGTAYANSGQMTTAAAMLERAEKLNPRDSEIQYDLGTALAKLGRTDQAIERLQAAEEVDPSQADAHYQLALAYRKKGEKARSKQEMEIFQKLKASETDEVTAGNRNNEGNRLMAEGRTEEASKAYREAVRLDPTNPRWQYNLSLALDKLGDRVGEQKALEKVIELDPNMAVAHNQLGLVYLAASKNNDAEHEFTTALQIDPKFAEAQNNLGVTYSKDGNDGQAEQLFRQAVENDPRYTRAFVNLGLTLGKRGNFQAAEETLQQAVKLAPNDGGALTALGMVEGKMGHHQVAIQVFKHLAVLEPESADAHVNLGIALADQYDLVGALREFTAATRLDPTSALAYYNKGRVLYDLDRRQEARPCLETAVRLAPDYPAALYLLAAVLGTTPEGTEVLEKLVKVDPNNADGQYLLGQCLLHEHRNQEAIAHWKAAVAADPENSSALYNLARTLNSLHDPEAAQYLARFQALEQRLHLSDRVQSLNNFALEAANARNWTQAVEQLREAIQDCGQCQQLPVLHRNLGLIYARKGDIEPGKRELRRALELNPKDTNATTALNILEHLPQQAPSPN